MQIVIALVMGGLIGWLASLAMGTSAQMGLIANILVGIVGSSLGYWLAPRVGVLPTARAGRWAIAILGAVILIVILKVLGVYE